MRIADLPNLGPASEAMLQRAGIETAEQLRETGVLTAYRKAIAAGASPNKNLLWALYGAVHDMDWRTIPAQEKQRLIIQLDALNDLEQQLR